METFTYKTIDEVLAEMERIIDNTIRDRNYMGIFAIVYWITTLQIKTNIEQGRFEDNDRMQRMDVQFATYYLDAYKKFTDKKPVSGPWEVAFSAGHERLTLLQHLLLGMNAHINLDLALAASRIMEDQPIKDLETDYNTINGILGGLVDRLQAKLGKASPLMFLLDWIGGRKDEKIINFSLAKARTQSWHIANEFWALKGDALQNRIVEVDQSITKLAEFIKNPKSGLLRFILKVISWFEVRDVVKILKRLRDNSNTLLLDPDKI